MIFWHDEAGAPIEARSMLLNCRRSHQSLMGWYAAAPMISTATTRQTPMMAKPRRRSAPRCSARILSMIAWRSDFLGLATGFYLAGDGAGGPHREGPDGPSGAEST